MTKAPVKKNKKAKMSSAKEKIAKGKVKAKLSSASSSVKKKKKKKIHEEEEIISKKRKKIAPVEVEEVEEDDIDDEDEDFRRVRSVSDSEDDAEDAEDEETSDEDDSDDSEPEPIHDLSVVDPGPDLNEVSCGYNCGSCTKFVKLDDPIRNDPAWITTQMERKARSRCPFLFPDEIDIAENKSINDYVVCADTKACDQFHFNEDRGSEELAQALNIVRKLQRDEIDVVSYLVERIRSLKLDEDKYGYKLGERMELRVKVKEGEAMVKCEVVDFQRKKGEEVIVRVMN